MRALDITDKDAAFVSRNVGNGWNLGEVGESDTVEISAGLEVRVKLSLL